MDKYKGHTPGPWKCEGTIYDDYVFTPSDGKWICQLWDKQEENFRSDEETSANAELIADAPQLLEKLEVTEQLLIDAITGHDKMLELKNKLAEQNEKLLKQLRYSRSICQIYLMYRNAYSLKMCGDCKICKVMAEVEGGE